MKRDEGRDCWILCVCACVRTCTKCLQYLMISVHHVISDTAVLFHINFCIITQEGASVLVHDTEGLDSTLQVTSLAQIILNPDCRTVRG